MANALKLGRRYGFKEVILESNCQGLVSRLTKGAIYFSDFDSVLGDVLSLSLFFSTIFWSRVKRDGNAVVHHLVRLVPFGVEQIWENHCPSEISLYVLMDTLSLN